MTARLEAAPITTLTTTEVKATVAVDSATDVRALLYIRQPERGDPAEDLIVDLRIAGDAIDTPEGAIGLTSLPVSSLRALACALTAIANEVEARGLLDVEILKRP
jgi:hypothetical protein